MLRLVGDPTDELRPIKRRVHQFHLGKACPAFATVSHSWGSSAVTKRILFIDSSFSVRESVWELLLQLRKYGIENKKQPPAYLRDRQLNKGRRRTSAGAQPSGCDIYVIDLTRDGNEPAPASSPARFDFEPLTPTRDKPTPTQTRKAGIWASGARFARPR